MPPLDKFCKCALLTMDSNIKVVIYNKSFSFFEYIFSCELSGKSPSIRLAFN